MRGGVRYVSSAEVIEGRLEGAYFIMPGGRDLPYVRSLKGKGTSNIRQFVEKGGTYVGVCAGAYFGGAYVSFDEGGPLQVTGERELKFYSGTVKGPVFGSFDYYSKKGAMALEIDWQEKLAVYFNGGGTFFGGDAHVIATYSNGHAAIVETRLGKGRALLSGVHFEYLPSDLDASLLAIKSKLNHEKILRLQHFLLN